MRIAIERVDAQHHAADVHAAEFHGRAPGPVRPPAGGRSRGGAACAPSGLGQHPEFAPDQAGHCHGRTCLQEFPACVRTWIQSEPVLPGLAVGNDHTCPEGPGFTLGPSLFAQLPYDLMNEITSPPSAIRAAPDRPLLELTIGALLERTASRYPDRLAVASRHQSKRMTWAELSDGSRPRSARPLVARHPPRRPRGPVVHQLHRVDHDAHGLRARRRGAGQRQPRLSLPRAAVTR